MFHTSMHNHQIPFKREIAWLSKECPCVQILWQILWLAMFSFRSNSVSLLHLFSILHSTQSLLAVPSVWLSYGYFDNKCIFFSCCAFCHASWLLLRLIKLIALWIKQAVGSICKACRIGKLKWNIILLPYNYLMKAHLRCSLSSPGTTSRTTLLPEVHISWCPNSGALFPLLFCLGFWKRYLV